MNVENLNKQAAEVAARFMKQMQSEGRTFNPNKHLKMTTQEFCAHHRVMTVMLHTGWYCYNNVPVWIED